MPSPRASLRTDGEDGGNVLHVEAPRRPRLVDRGAHFVDAGKRTHRERDLARDGLEEGEGPLVDGSARRVGDLPVVHGLIERVGLRRDLHLEIDHEVLGLVPLSEDNWAVMLNLAWERGAIYLPNAFPYILGPTAAIVLLQFCLVLTLRALDEVFNPRLRRG